MQKVLVANRGEIACRVMKACRALGLRTVAVYSEADAGALHVAMADEAVPIGPAKAADSYLSVGNVLAALEATGAHAVHPGYGFLAENAAFAEAVQAAGAAWIGPAPQTITDMGDKERARMLAHGAGVPIVPGSPRFLEGDIAGLADFAREIGFPLLVKASAGGGGIGMRRVDELEALEGVVSATQALSHKAFSDGTIYLEKLVEPARHIEVQVFGFGDGHAIHLFERECSVQRRFQKVVEESPSPGLAPETRARMCEAAVALAKQERYRGAGTVEFVVGPDQDYYFLEMNTRIQVEHPVTEMRTGVDLVAAQVHFARGDAMPDWFTRGAIDANGHTIECRVYAERPEKNFLPSPGTITDYATPALSLHVRVDSGVRVGDQITFHYDPMIAKVIVHGATRDEAIDRMRDALTAFRIEGVYTNIPFLIRLMDHADFRAGRIHTTFLQGIMADLV